MGFATMAGMSCGSSNNYATGGRSADATTTLTSPATRVAGIPTSSSDTAVAITPRPRTEQTPLRTALPTVVPTSQRSSSDRPDDSANYQVHVMYVLPSDGQDDALDTSGTIATSVSAFNTWLGQQTGGPRLRLDTYQGALDVTFFRLSRGDSEIRARGAYVRDEIEAELKAAGFDQRNKILAVYYGGGSTYACGGGAWPPSLVGTVAAAYLRGTPPGATPCDSNALASTPSQPGYFEFAMLHEIMHTIGFVAACAPYHTQSGHVSDDPHDLMYAGPLPWEPSVLDSGRNDYYRHALPGCLDLAKSVFLDPATPGAAVPPGW